LYYILTDIYSEEARERIYGIMQEQKVSWYGTTKD
jgi:hypothetical protein